MVLGLDVLAQLVVHRRGEVLGLAVVHGEAGLEGGGGVVAVAVGVQSGLGRVGGERRGGGDGLGLAALDELVPAVELVAGVGGGGGALKPLGRHDLDGVGVVGDGAAGRGRVGHLDGGVGVGNKVNPNRCAAGNVIELPICIRASNAALNRFFTRNDRFRFAHVVGSHRYCVTCEVFDQEGYIGAIQLVVGIGDLDAVPIRHCVKIRRMVFKI